MDVRIDRPAAADRAGWEPLYRGYRAFYERPHDPAAIDAVWDWITTDGAPLEGRVARAADGTIVGLIHFRDVPRPLEGATGGYLDDLFVAENARGTGVAGALMEALCDIGRARGWTDVRWLTAETNARARTFYDRISEKTPFLTYQIRLGA